MSKIEEIRTRLDRGYVLSLYGNSEYLYKQMEEDISYLLSFIGTQKRIIENRIVELEIQLINTNPKRKETVLRRQEVIDELKNLLK